MLTDRLYFLLNYLYLVNTYLFIDAIPIPYFSSLITTSNILNDVIAFKAWGTSAGIIILCPHTKLNISPLILISASPSSIVTKASPGDVCSLIDSSLSKENSVIPVFLYWTKVLLATASDSKLISFFNSKTFCYPILLIYILGHL